MMTNDKKLAGIVAGAGISIALLWWLLKAQAAPPPPPPPSEREVEVTGFSIKKG